MPPTPQPPGRECTIPWGPRETLHLRFPDSWPAPSLQAADVTGAISDYPSALALALKAPLASATLSELAAQAGSAAIIADDPSRWTPVRSALPVVLEHLHAAGLKPENISISLGVGRHQRVDDHAMRQRLGDSAVDAYQCFSPPLDDSAQYDSLGITPLGVPVRVFQPVARARLRVLIGSVLPHLQAGFGGGFKLIFPGCSHRSTLGALHRQGLSHHADARRLLGGDPATNPMRLAIAQAAALLDGANFSIGHVMGAPSQVLHLACGDVDAVQARLSNDAQARYRRVVEPARAVVVGNFPWPGDPMMSFKALINHLAAVQPNGVLIGCFWTDPAELERSLPTNVLKPIAASGRLGAALIRRGLRAADRAVTWLKHPSRFMLRWARELVADQTVLVLAPELAHRFGPCLGPVRLFSNQSDLWAAAEQALRKPPDSLAVFPYGGLTYSVIH
jgi:hypothetical protein